MDHSAVLWTDGWKSRVFSHFGPHQLNNDLLNHSLVPWCSILSFRWFIIPFDDFCCPDEPWFDRFLTVFFFSPFRWLRAFRKLYASHRKQVFQWKMKCWPNRLSHWNWFPNDTLKLGFRQIVVSPISPFNHWKTSLLVANEPSELSPKPPKMLFPQLLLPAFGG